MPISHKLVGNFPKISFAVAYIPYYLFTALPDPDDENCISNKFYQFNLAEFVKYVI
jgi:hypothetical protein